MNDPLLTPRIPQLLPTDSGALVADDATLIGALELGEETSVWYGSIIRADVARIRLGKRTNVQDACVIHPQTNEHITIGDEITFGHGVIFHGRELGNRCLLGMRATVMSGAVIGEECIIGAGALVTEGKVIPPGSVVLGSPGKVVRQITEKERAFFEVSARRYVELARKHVGGFKP